MRWRSPLDDEIRRAVPEWPIPPAACVEINDVLDANCVNESSLFPDRDGRSRYVGWRYKWGKLSGMKRSAAAKGIVVPRSTRRAG